jgi:hypothetical protein
MDLNLCYLWLTPLGPNPPAGPVQPPLTPRDAPYFYDIDIEFRGAGERQFEIEGLPVRVLLQVLDDTVLLAECRYTLPDGLGESAVARKRAINAALRERLQAETGSPAGLFEGYTVVLLRQAPPTPAEFVDEHAVALASLLRSLTKPLDQPDAVEILAARARYSANDLTVIDWDGALVIAEDGDYQSDIELLKIGNYQLLRLRLIDQGIEASLRALRANVERARPAWLPTPNRTLQAVVQQRLELLLDFEKIDQSLLLIGDWYSARVYRIIVEQFYLGDWKATVSGKLDSLADIDGIVSQRLAFSWQRVLEFVQVAGWLVLLVGYFVLFIADLSRPR